MKAEDLLSEGERAKRHLRVAQALAMLSKMRAPSLNRVKGALSRVQGNQPAVAMAVILEYSKHHPLHERGVWLEAAGMALQEYRLSEDADQKEAELARDHIEHELSLYKAEIERIEKIRERFSLALLFALVAAMIAGLVYIGYSFAPPDTAMSSEADKSTTPKKNDEKTAAPKTDPDKTKAPHAEGKSTAEKPKPAETKKTDKDSKSANPVGK